MKPMIYTLRDEYLARADRTLMLALLCLVLSQVAEFWLVRWAAGFGFGAWAVLAALNYWASRQEWA